jgi:hypothetical protein
MAQFGVDKNNDTPFCALFRPISKEVGCTDSLCGRIVLTFTK